MIHSRFLVCTICFFNVLALEVNTSLAETQDPEPFTLRDGDRIAFLGNSFFERAIDHGHIELSFASSWPNAKVTFRNLGWDGDTVFGHARTGGRRRAVFGTVEEGFERMVAHVKKLQPNMIVLAYGFNESFAGQDGITAFQTGLNRLIEALEPESTRIVLLSPIPMQTDFTSQVAASNVTDANYVASRNKILARYRDIISQVAKSKGHTFVDLFEQLQSADRKLTSNGIHPTEEGYRHIAQVIHKQLKLPEPTFELNSKAAESIRKTIIKKNRLYYHRWRPRNDAFVYGERKDEQRTAQTEPEKFEPFIDRQEKRIWQMLSELGGVK